MPSITKATVYPLWPDRWTWKLSVGLPAVRQTVVCSENYETEQDAITGVQHFLRFVHHSTATIRVLGKKGARTLFPGREEDPLEIPEGGE